MLNFITPPNLSLLILKVEIIKHETKGNNTCKVPRKLVLSKLKLLFLLLLVVELL